MPEAGEAGRDAAFPDPGRSRVDDDQGAVVAIFSVVLRPAVQAQQGVALGGPEDALDVGDATARDPGQAKVCFAAARRAIVRLITNKRHWDRCSTLSVRSCRALPGSNRFGPARRGDSHQAQAVPLFTRRRGPLSRGYVPESGRVIVSRTAQDLHCNEEGPRSYLGVKCDGNHDSREAKQ